MNASRLTLHEALLVLMRETPKRVAAPKKGAGRRQVAGCDPKKADGDQYAREGCYRNQFPPTPLCFVYAQSKNEPGEREKRRTAKGVTTDVIPRQKGSLILAGEGGLNGGGVVG